MLLGELGLVHLGQAGVFAAGRRQPIEGLARTRLRGILGEGRAPGVEGQAGVALLLLPDAGDLGQDLDAHARRLLAPAGAARAARPAGPTRAGPAAPAPGRPPPAAGRPRPPRSATAPRGRSRGRGCGSGCPGSGRWRRWCRPGSPPGRRPGRPARPARAPWPPAARRSSTSSSSMCCCSRVKMRSSMARASESPGLASSTARSWLAASCGLLQLLLVDPGAEEAQVAQRLRVPGQLDLALVDVDQVAPLARGHVEPGQGVERLLVGVVDVEHPPPAVDGLVRVLEGVLEQHRHPLGQGLAPLGVADDLQVLLEHLGQLVLAAGLGQQPLEGDEGRPRRRAGRRWPSARPRWPPGRRPAGPPAPRRSSTTGPRTAPVSSARSVPLVRISTSG